MTAPLENIAKGAKRKWIVVAIILEMVVPWVQNTLFHVIPPREGHWKTLDVLFSISNEIKTENEEN